MIGPDLTLLGEKITIVCQNTLQVDGDVRGNVHAKQVVIAANGSVTGMVCAEKIEVHGGVCGSIRAVTVTLYATAQVDGDIMHHALAICEGAQFDGLARRANGSMQLMPVLDPNVIAASENDGERGIVLTARWTCGWHECETETQLSALLSQPAPTTTPIP